MNCKRFYCENGSLSISTNGVGHIWRLSVVSAEMEHSYEDDSRRKVFLAYDQGGSFLEQLALRFLGECFLGEEDFHTALA